MKKISLIFFSAFFVTNISLACPYSSMAQIDKQLEFNKNLDKAIIVKVLNLRNKGELELKSGNVQKSEEILNEALALLR